jgi:hypothetical protein
MTTRTRSLHLPVAALLAPVLLAACNPVSTGSAIDPINVQAGVFFDQTCAQAHAIYTVPVGKLLVIEDASASAVDAASASDPGNPGILDDVPVRLSIRTNPTGTIAFGSADHIIVNQVGLPAGPGRSMRGYAAPGTEILFLQGGCTVPINTTVYFSGHLVDWPGQ